MGFWSANIQRYYTVQQLIVKLSSVRAETTVKRGIKGGKLIISFSYLCNCIIIYYIGSRFLQVCYEYVVESAG